MAVEKTFRDDISGVTIAKDQVIVVRVGTLDDRPEDCDRFDIGPGSYDFPIAALTDRWRALRAEAGDG